MYTAFVVAIAIVWPVTLVSACLLVRGGAIHERNLAQLDEAQRNIQRALAL